MNKYNDLESTLMCCFLMKPELMEETILEDKHFINNKKTWIFMKTFYNKFKNFDVSLMVAVAKDKYFVLDSIEYILSKYANFKNFKIYEQELIDEFEELKKDKYIRERVYELANNLYIRNITTDDFKHKVVAIYRNADEIFKKGDD